MVTPRILFITPAASRSGAPMLMLHLIRWLRKNTGLQMSAVLVSGGEMDSEFSAEIPTQIFFEKQTIPTSRLMRWLERRTFIVRRKEAHRLQRARSVVNHWPPDLVYCNSAAAAGVLDALGPYPCPVIVNLHELPYVLQAINWIPGGVIPLLKRNATHYVAGSRIVGSSLTKKYDLPSDQITVIHDFIDVSDFKLNTQSRQIDPDVRSALARVGIPDNALIVGFIATVEWRKGADLLIPIAQALISNAPDLPVHFIWVGGGPVADVTQLQFDIDTSGLGSRVHLLGATDRTSKWYPCFNLFALLSREDPFPLVCLEAAATGLPIVCFQNGGGMPEFVENDCGITVPFLDLNQMAQAMERLLRDADLREKMGALAAQKVRERHDIRIAGPQVLHIMEQLLAQTRPDQQARKLQIQNAS